MPEGIPEPEQLPDLERHLEGADPVARALLTGRPIELRHVPSPLYTSVEGDPAPSQAVWMRTRGTMPDTPGLHRAALAYMSDMSIQEPVLRAHGLAWATPGLKVASLDHAMWWHRFARVDEWLLYVQESPSARGGRGLSLGRVFTRAGVLVATVAQEITIRVPEAS